MSICASGINGYQLDTMFRGDATVVQQIMIELNVAALEEEK